MKNHHIAWLLPLLFCCCKKTNAPSNPPVAFTFTTTYDSVIKCYANSPYAFSFNVNVLSGDIGSNHINYRISGLPAGITAQPDSLSVSYIMGGVFNFTIGNMPVGFDTAGFVISSASNGTQTHKLIFNVQKPFDYSPLLAGAYTHCFDFCQPDSFFYYSSVVTTVTDTPYLIKISNIKNLGTGYKVRALISKVVTIPSQNLGVFTIWGSGTFFKDTSNNYQMLINDTLVNGVDTQRCTIHIVH